MNVAVPTKGPFNPVEGEAGCIQDLTLWYRAKLLIVHYTIVSSTQPLPAQG